MPRWAALHTLLFWSGVGAVAALTVFRLDAIPDGWRERLRFLVEQTLK